MERKIEFLNLVRNLQIDELKALEEQQIKLNKNIPYDVSFSNDYLWQVHYSMVSKKYFMLVPTKETDCTALFYVIKKQLENKEQNISCIIFNNPEQQIINLFSKFKNLDLIKADISEELVDSVAKADATILFAKVGKTDATLYKNIKEIIKKKNKPILEEVLV